MKNVCLVVCLVAWLTLIPTGVCLAAESETGTFSWEGFSLIPAPPDGSTAVAGEPETIGLAVLAGLCKEWPLTGLETMQTISGTVILLVFDKPIYDFIQLHEPDVVDRLISPVVTRLAEWPVMLGTAAVLLFIDPQTSLDMIVVYLVNGLNTIVLKSLFGMSRPTVSDVPVFIGPTLDDQYMALPSGHTSSAFAMATILALRFPGYSPLFYTVATLVGLSRITEEKHWPSNVFMGAMVGIASGRQVANNQIRLVTVRF